MGSAGRLQSVDYLRGIAAFAVMWFHLTNGSPLFSEGLVRWSGAYGYTGVAVFFVISGFIIPYSLSAQSYSPRRDGPSFFLRRIIRLEPPYLIAATFGALLFYASSITPGFRGQPWPTLFRDIALHPAYMVPWFNGNWINPVFWTLAIEFQYYLAILFLAPALLSNKRWANRAALAASLLLSLAIADSRLFFHYLPLFGLGFIAFLIMRHALPKLELGLWSVAYLLGCAYNLGTSYTIAAAITAAALFVRWPDGLRSLAFLGAISYSLYLLHVPIGGRVLNLATRLPDTVALKLVALAGATALSLASAYAFWRLVEVPSIAWARRMKPTDTHQPKIA